MSLRLRLLFLLLLLLLLLLRGSVGVVHDLWSSGLVSGVENLVSFVIIRDHLSREFRAVGLLLLGLD